MTLYRFNQLDEMEQMETVWSGTHIGTRSNADQDILLYQMGSLYTEVFYNRESNLIQKVNAFEVLSQLRPYLHQINITGLN